jgi:hypothetical protein
LMQCTHQAVVHDERIWSPDYRIIECLISLYILPNRID